MDEFTCRNFGSDVIQEADELLMSMALHVAANDRAVENVQGSEQCGGAVTLVVAGYRSGTAPLQREARLSTVERLVWLFSSTLSTIAWAGGST